MNKNMLLIFILFAIKSKQFILKKFNLTIFILFISIINKFLK